MCIKILTHLVCMLLVVVIEFAVTDKIGCWRKAMGTISRTLQTLMAVGFLAYASITAKEQLEKAAGSSASSVSVPPASGTPVTPSAGTAGGYTVSPSSGTAGGYTVSPSSGTATNSQSTTSTKK